MPNDGSGRPDVSFLSLVVPALERWRAIAVVFLLSVVASAITIMLLPRHYEALVSVSTVSSGRQLPGELTSLLGTMNASGLQATPSLVFLLADQPGVLYRTAMRPSGNNAAPRIVDRLALVEGEIPDGDVVRSMSALMSRSIDKETGVITFRIVSKDSGLARVVAHALVDEVSATFLNAAKTQAAQLREALTTRVDSAQRQLTRAEEAQRSFLARNRIVAQYSEAALDEQRLRAAVELAQTIYAQVLKEREIAIGKELEDTPAVVIIDAPSRTLLPVPRRTVLKSLGVGLFAIAIAWFAFLMREGVSSGSVSNAHERQRLHAALRTIPVFGAALVKFFRVDDAGSAAPGRVT